MKKSLTHACLSFILLTGMGAASTISLTDTGTAAGKFTSSTGAALTSATIMIGYINGFDPANSSMMQTLKSGNLSQVVSLFIPLGVPYTGAGPAITIGNASTVVYNTTTGFTSGNVGNVTPVAASATVLANSYQGANGVVVGTRFFVLALNQADTVTRSGTEFALISADPVVSTAWTMPSSSLTNRSLLTTSVDTAPEFFYGKAGSIQLSPVAVPEPATSVLFLLGAAVGLRRRR